MISFHNISDAGAALQYFSKDNYYTQNQGLDHSEWFGNGAKILDLVGQINREPFFTILNGKIAGQELGKWVHNEKTGEKEREHRPGIDITFSAPKSVSILAEIQGQHEVRDAHEAAVKKALSYMEKELTQTRQTQGGKTETVKTGHLVVGMFRHNTSRDLDPQTHTHAVIMNVTRRKDGQWRSLSNEEFFNAQRVIGAIYTSELAWHLRALGYDLRRVDEKGNFEISAITREQIEHFSQRRSEITAFLKAKGINIDQASAQQKEYATLKTRSHKKDVDHVALITEWKARAKAMGIDFSEIQSRSKTQCMRGEIILEDSLTGLQAMEFSAAHLIEREAVVSKNALLATAIEHSAGRVSTVEVERAFNKLEKDGDLVKLPDGLYTTKKMLGNEMWALDQVKAQQGKMPKIMASDEIVARIEQAERQQRFKYSPGQKEALHKVLTSEDRYVAIQGLAGTGKTTLLKSLRQLAQEQGYTVRGMAPTGAASKVLVRQTGIVTDTVSMFQIKERQLQKDIVFAKQYAPDFERKAEIWIVDESSFLSQRQKAQLDYMAEQAGARMVYLGDRHQLQSIEAGKPFELMQCNGVDTSQMTDINRQKTDDLKQAIDVITGRDHLQPGQRLTQIELKHNARAFAFMDKSGMVHEVKGGSSALVESVVQTILKLDAAEREQTIVITAYNEDRKAINASVRHRLKMQGELAKHEQTHEILLSKGWTRAVQQEAQYYKVGDVVRFGRDYQQIDAKKGEYMRVVAVDASTHTVMLQKDDHSKIAWHPKKHNKIEVYDSDTRELAQGDLIRITRNEGELKNGEIAKVSTVDGHHVTLALRQGKEVVFLPVDLSRHKHWDHAYASTVHSAQGVTQYRTIFHLRVQEKDNEHQQDHALNKMAKVFGDRSFYVAVTRASHRLCIYTNNKVLAAKVVAVRQDKTSAIDTIQRYEKGARSFQFSRSFQR